MAAENGEVPEERGSISVPISSSPATTFDISSFTHTPFYCEENVYLLCKKLSLIGVADPKGFDLFVVFISNEEKKIPLWYQKASKRLDGLVMWDYHVVCIQSQRNGEGNARLLVWDLDSSLPFPFPLKQYVTAAIQPTVAYSRLFRVLHAPIFFRFFASDRSHMKDPLGNWISMPPTYEPIVAEDGTVSNIDEYIQMRAADVMTNLEAAVDAVLSKKYGVVITWLYATSNINLPNFFQKKKMSNIWNTHANWMGYIAVATDPEEIKLLGRRDISVAWRGTVTYLEWIHDLKDILAPTNFSNDSSSVKVESGFLDIYTQKEHECNYCSFSSREQVLADIKRLVDSYKDEELSTTITGHSLGAALALLSAYDIAEMGLNVRENGQKIPITVFSFSSPRVGNLKFKARCDELGVKVLRVINIHDKVPTVPGIIANEKFHYQKYIEDVVSFPWSYAHVGVELALDHRNLPFLKETIDMGCPHNLEAHLHIVDRYHGKGRQFSLARKRDIASVNKSSNFLREFGVPPKWRQDENKGMVKRMDGRWVLPERPRMEVHPPDTAHHLEQVLKQHMSSPLKST